MVRLKPIVETKSPINADVSPRKILPASRPTTLDKPSTVNAKVSTKPSRSANFASIGANRSSTSEQMAPPTTEEVMAMDSALPA